MFIRHIWYMTLIRTNCLFHVSCFTSDLHVFSLQFCIDLRILSDACSSSPYEILFICLLICSNSTSTLSFQNPIRKNLRSILTWIITISNQQCQTATNSGVLFTIYLFGANQKEIVTPNVPVSAIQTDLTM